MPQTNSTIDKIQVSLLKEQLHPHFLFNTLNGLYALAIKKSDKTATGIAQLADLMRYLMGEGQAPEVSLPIELDYVANYIALQQLRLTAQTEVRLSIADQTMNQTIAPLLLTPFIENAFKYGVNNDIFSVISIKIACELTQLNLWVQNNKVATDVISHKIGLATTQKRLQLLYPNRHTLNIFDEPTTYTVDLAIRLK